jgi:hypothetical protein
VPFRTQLPAPAGYTMSYSLEDILEAAREAHQNAQEAAQ